MKLRNCLALLVPILAFSGCASLDQVAYTIQKIIGPVMVNDTPSQICQATKDNEVRANNTYSGKGISVNGKIISITDDDVSYMLGSVLPRYTVTLEAGTALIHARTDNKAKVTALTVGNSVHVSGTMTNVSLLKVLNGCSISLEDVKL